jgi:site-specific DNA-methyltransferase (adenine-specific)
LDTPAKKRRPGEVRDAIVEVLSSMPQGAYVHEIEAAVAQRIGHVPPSSIRSYLRLNTPGMFLRTERAQYSLFDPAAIPAASGARSAAEQPPRLFEYGRALLFGEDCCDWLRRRERNSVHAVVTDPPYGLFEYSEEQQEKLRNGKGGVWRIPPSFDGAKRSPLPRFTVLGQDDLKRLDEFFHAWARLLFPALVPGANILVASNPLLSYAVSGALARAQGSSAGARSCAWS